MLPALRDCPAIELAAVASRSTEKAERVAAEFGCTAHHGYEALLADAAIDAVYVPLPTGLHEKWVTAALGAGKHALVEKSSAMDAASARRMAGLAGDRGLLLVENFLFPHHSQTAWVQAALKGGMLGRLVELRATFSFPHRADDDIRYVRELGGGALYDVGTYALRAARLLLGDDLRVAGATLTDDAARGVDVHGTALLDHTGGQVAQLSWGIGLQYECRWDLLGTGGRMVLERAFTPPPGLQPTVRIECGRELRTETLPADDYYGNMLRHFAAAVRDPAAHATERESLVRQALLLDAVRRSATQGATT